MAALKKWFENKKLDVKFKKAGDGHKVSDNAASKPEISASKSVQRNPGEKTLAQQQAAEAALARISQSKPGLKSISTKRPESVSEVKTKTSSDEIDFGAVIIADDSEAKEESVLFECPLIPGVILSKNEIENQIKEFLSSQFIEDPLIGSSCMIHTNNKDKEKIDAGVEILMKYLTNIINNPGEEKYCKVKTSNKIYLEKVASLNGAEEFMLSAGFKKELKTNADNIEEEYYVMDKEIAENNEKLNMIKDVLHNAGPIKPQLYRDLKLFSPSMKAHEILVPNDFYKFTPEELKRQQQEKKDVTERLTTLRTKEMREMEQLRELRNYRYTRIRVKFPDGLLLQGTFYATDKLEVLINFVRENLRDDWLPFNLKTHNKIELNDSEKSLALLQLAPAALVYFFCDPDVEQELINNSETDSYSFLKDEILNSILTL